MTPGQTSKKNSAFTLVWLNTALQMNWLFQAPVTVEKFNVLQLAFSRCEGMRESECLLSLSYREASW